MTMADGGRLQRWRVQLVDGERREALTFPAQDEATVRAAVANWLIDRPCWRVERIERVLRGAKRSE